MVRRPTRFERDLAELHGDVDVEIVEGPARRSYRVISGAKPFMADYPPFVRVAALVLGVVILVPILIGAAVALLTGIAGILFGLKLMAG